MNIKRSILLLVVIFLSACSNGKHFIQEDGQQTAENMIEQINAFQDFEYEIIKTEDEINTLGTDVLFIDNGTFITMTETGAIQEIYFYDVTNDDIQDIFHFMGLRIPQDMKRMMKDKQVDSNGYQDQVKNINIFYDDGASVPGVNRESNENLIFLKITLSAE